MDETFKIRPEWDAGVTYDDLSNETSGGAVFVGREEMLDVIVGAIRQPDRRGTFLISGYRGAGKTTLLIESIRQAKKLLPADWTLMPLVLNASEVSAALPAAAASAQPAGAVALQIGPQQLLTALIRTLRNYAADLKARAAAQPAEAKTVKPLSTEIETAIHETYRKAVAKEYSLSEGSKTEQTRTLTQEIELKLSTADVYKSLTAFGAAAAGVIEISAWFPSGSKNTIHALAAAVGALSVASWTASRKLSSVASQQNSQAVSVKFDNSLQQLEGDLKDLLSRLYAGKMRVVVVLEELDKLRDEDGQQLDSVIRYFKNLFTQAPALFFFVTDKAYYDFIASEIRKARRERSYAIQHTFFTHRLFVGRPTTRDCLKFLKSVLVESKDGEKLDKLYDPKGYVPFSTAIAGDPLLRLVRSLLFKSANHLFDLKNELRRFVRTEGADLVINTKKLSDDDVAAGIFQDLIVEKYGLFAFGDSRPYVNEILSDCLYAVFSDLGSDVAQAVKGYYPRERAATSATPAASVTTTTATPTVAATPAPAAAPAVPMRTSEDQLELSEQVRIRAAVDSLIEDLHRGGAFDAEKTNIAQGEFIWKRTAAGSFHFQRRLERHETDLVGNFEKLRSQVAAFATGAPLANIVGVSVQADEFVKEIESKKKEVETTDRTLSVDESDKLSLEWQGRATELIKKAYERHVVRVSERFGLTFGPIGTSAEGGNLFLIRTAIGDPRGQEGRPGGAVLLAQGEGARLGDDVREFVGRSPGLRRLAIVHVLHAPEDPTALKTRVAQWQQQLAESIQPPRLVVETLPLDEAWPTEAIAESWGDKLAERVLLHTRWTEMASTQPISTGLSVDDLAALVNDQPESQPFWRRVSDWISTDERILLAFWDPAWNIEESKKDHLSGACVEAISRTDVPEIASYVWPIGTDSSLTGLVGPILNTVSASRFDSATYVHVSRVAARLISARELIPVFVPFLSPPGSQSDGGVSGQVNAPRIRQTKAPEATFPDATTFWSSIEEVCGDKGRAIVVARESWQGSIPEGWTRRILRVQPAPARKAS